VAEVTDANDGYKKSAAHLMIDGAFNVNSTSVDAWAALLGSLNDETVDFMHLAEGSATATSGTIPKASYPFPRMRRGNGPALTTSGSLDRHSRWTGTRSLDDSQIRELAQHIVDEIKERGPFLSLANFVNRSPGNDNEKALEGMLQTAIDKTASINSSFSADSNFYTAANLAADNYPFAKAMEGMSATGAPGYLTQGDILSAIGSVISVRSDTFRIRGYGEALDPDKKVVARAWCEAVVQRMPEFVDPVDQASADITNVSDTNKRFGRRFVVTGFRWLGQDEV
jgi:hypothetical protein